MGHPTWRYHATEKARIFDSDELAGLSDDWKDSPAKVHAPASKPEVLKAEAPKMDKPKKSNALKAEKDDGNTDKDA